MASRHFDDVLTEEEIRQQVADGRRLVIKVGSSSLSSASHGLDEERVAALVTWPMPTTTAATSC